MVQVEKKVIVHFLIKLKITIHFWFHNLNAMFVWASAIWSFAIKGCSEWMQTLMIVLLFWALILPIWRGVHSWTCYAFEPNTHENGSRKINLEKRRIIQWMCVCVCHAASIQGKIHKVYADVIFQHHSCPVMAWFICLFNLTKIINSHWISMKIDILQIKCSHSAASINMCANALCVCVCVIASVWTNRFDR